MRPRNVMMATIGVFLLSLFIWACANQGKDSVEEADSANKVDRKAADSTGAYSADEATSKFLVRAADGGKAEVRMAELASGKSSRDDVKKFSAMLIEHHNQANERVKTLATERKVILPDSLSEDKMKAYQDLSDKNGKEFDRKYINVMIDDHQNDIKVFEEAVEKSGDDQVRSFAQSTLPLLRSHLDSLKVLKDRIK